MKPQQPLSLGLWEMGDESEVGGWNNVLPHPPCPALKTVGGAGSRDRENWLHPFPFPREARVEKKSSLSEY